MITNAIELTVSDINIVDYELANQVATILL